MARISEPPDKLSSLEIVCDALACGQPVPALEAAWLESGIRRYIEHEGSSLTKELGLRPRRGGARETIWALKRQRERDRLIQQAADTLCGSAYARAVDLARLLKEYASAAESQGQSDQSPLALLLARHRDHLPESPMQISRILKGETISARRNTKKPLFVNLLGHVMMES